MTGNRNPRACVFIPLSHIEETLRSGSVVGKRLLEPMKAFSALYGLPLNILEDREVSNTAEVHRHENDLWFCLEGEATFVYGGALAGPIAVKQLPDGGTDDRELKSEKIEGGTEIVMRPGDWLWVPAGQPHAHRATGVARLVIIKIPQREEVLLEDVPGWRK